MSHYNVLKSRLYLASKYVLIKFKLAVLWMISDFKFLFQIVVVGPVEYRKGVLLLKSSNVHFIGGEVEHLLIKNAPLNVLCRAL